ncbi:MAG: serine hydrolase [Trueperaceae bacterium]
MSRAEFWSRLRHDIERRVDAFDGVAGVALADLSSGERLEVRGAERFPSASTIKIHLLAALVQLHQDGVVDLDERVRVTGGVPGSAVLGCLDDLVELTWRDVANLMIMVSDNTATNLIIDHIGLERMAEFLELWQLGNTVVARKMQDARAVAAGLENLASPLDTLSLLERLSSGAGFSTGVAEECLRILKKPKKSPFRSALPASVEMANKPGALPRVQCEAAIVYLPRRPFGLVIMSSFGPVDPREQTYWLTGLARSIFDAMAVLDACTEHGRG